MIRKHKWIYALLIAGIFALGTTSPLYAESGAEEEEEPVQAMPNPVEKSGAQPATKTQTQTKQMQQTQQQQQKQKMQSAPQQKKQMNQQQMQKQVR